MQEQDFKKFIEQVRSRNNIVEVISQSVRLDRRGYNYWGSCPFHADKTPSFTVNEDKNIYHCFSCHRGGDVFKFIMENDNLTFIEALERLAARVGLEMPEFTAFNRGESNTVKYNRLYQILTDTARFYHANLKSELGATCLTYINNRGIMMSTVTNFGIGYSADYDALPRYLLGKGYTEDEILTTGVCLKNSKGDLYDFEGGRMVIPIMDKSGKVVAFGGRLLEKKSNAGKYLNTKETLLFKKKKEIFGYNNLKKAKQENKLTHLILVEGYMDVISLAQAGFNNACASMGTAFGVDHCKILEFYNKNIYLCYDGDEAGQKAIETAIAILREYNKFMIKVVMLPDGLDPDDYIKKYGRDSFTELINNAVSTTEYLMMRLLRKYNQNDPDAKAACVQEAVSLLKDLPTQVEREIYLPFAARIFNISAESLSQDLNMTERNTEVTASSPKEKDMSRVNPKYDKYLYSARYVLHALIKGYLRLANPDEDLSVFFIDSDHKAIFDLIRYNNGTQPLTADIVESVSSREGREIMSLAEYKPPRGETQNKFYDDCLNNLKEQYYDVMFNDINQEFKEEKDIERRKELMTLLNEIAKAKREIKGK